MRVTDGVRSSVIDRTKHIKRNKCSDRTFDEQVFGAGQIGHGSGSGYC